MSQLEGDMYGWREDTDEENEEGEISVIPESYLEDEEPYMCGVLECKRLFHTYAELVHHASSHPAVALRWCAYSDLMA